MRCTYSVLANPKHNPVTGRFLKDFKQRNDKRDGIFPLLTYLPNEHGRADVSNVRSCRGKFE